MTVLHVMCFSYECNNVDNGVFVSGTFCNSLFVTLLTAELDKDLKKSSKNLEVRLVVLNSLGVELPVGTC